MASYPDVQLRAQAELDAVVGTGRLPEFDDQEALPYVNALVKELLRWRTVEPTGFPHTNDWEDEFMGYTVRLPHPASQAKILTPHPHRSQKAPSSSQ